MNVDNFSNHKGVVVWLTGLSGSGKSTVAQLLKSNFNRLDRQSCVLDGDVIRTGLSSDLGFSSADRVENIRRVGEVAKLFCDMGIIVIVAFISPYQANRKRVRDLLGENQFVEVFVDCPIRECERRDPKGLYLKARSGEINNFTGISAPYEIPENPEVHLLTDQCSPNECVDRILDYLKVKDLLDSRSLVFENFNKE